GKAKAAKFSDGEINVTVGETVRGSDCYIIQSTCDPVNDNLMELLIMIDAMKRASAGRINAVIPFFGYARQDRKAKARDSISAKLVANLLESAGADRVITMDLHAMQIQGFFDIPVDHLQGRPVLAEYYTEKKADDIVIVSPDHGGVVRARYMAEMLECPIAIVDKRRPAPNQSEVMNVIGDVKDKNCIILDDMIDTAGSITNAASAIKKLGAKNVYVAVTHGVLSGPAIERLENSVIEEVIILNTIPLTDEKKKSTKIKTLSVAPIFAESIRRIHNNEPLSVMF
ncbi:MAG: ribose-phosphate pyrophosphokinase, partial [Clostridia bacterium]